MWKAQKSAFTRRRPRKENVMSTVDPHAGHAHADTEMPKLHETPTDGPTAVDPVCGMTVSLKPDTRTESLGGEDFHFCSGKDWLCRQE